MAIIKYKGPASDEDLLAGERDLENSITPKVDQIAAGQDAALDATKNPYQGDWIDRLADKAPAQPAPVVAPAPAPVVAPPPAPISPLTGFKLPAPIHDLPAPHDFTPEMRDARERADKLNLIANLGRASDTITTALSGAKISQVFNNGIDQQAEAPEKRVREDESMTRLAEANQAKKALADPASPRNRQAQDAFIAAAGPRLVAQLGEDNIRKMTAEQIDTSTNANEKRMTREEKEREDKNNDEVKAATLKHLTGADTETNRHNLADEKTADYKAHHPAVSPTANLVQDRHIDEMSRRLGGDTAKFTPTFEALQKIEDLAPGLIYGKVNPNNPLTRAQKILTGPLSGLGGEALADPKALDLQNAIDALQIAMGKDVSGAVISDAEQKRFQKNLGNSLSASPETMATALQRVGSILREKMLNQQIAYDKRDRLHPNDPTILEMHEGNGGLSYRDPLFSGYGPVQTHHPAMKVFHPDPAPNGAPPLNTSTPVREPGGNVAAVPDQGPAKKQYSPSRNQTRVVAPDGTVTFEPGDTRGK